MIKIAVLEDSEFDYARICKAWERFSKEYYLSYELTRFNDSASLLEQFHSQFDLLFLDIEVPEKMEWKQLKIYDKRIIRS